MSTIKNTDDINGLCPECKGNILVLHTLGMMGGSDTPVDAECETKKCKETFIYYPDTKTVKRK